LAAVNTKWNAAAYSCENEESKTPDPGHTSRNFSREIVGLTSANRANQLARRDESLIVGDEALVVWIVALVASEYLIGRYVVWILVVAVVSGWRWRVIGS